MMTTEEVIERVSQITSCDRANKQAIIDRYMHYQKASDEELLDSCIIIQGMIMGSESTVAHLRKLTSGVDTMQRVVRMIEKQYHQQSAVHFLVAEENLPEFVALDDEVTMSYRRIAALIASYAYGVEYCNVDEVEGARKEREWALAELKKLKDQAMVTRFLQKGFFGAVAGTREKQELLAKSKIAERILDEMLSDEPDQQTELFDERQG